VTLFCSTCLTYARIGSSEKPVTSFSIYPNPTTNYVNINLSELEKAELEIHNVLGKKVVKQQVYGGANRLELDHLPAGVYFCKLYSNQQLIGEEKLIISK
jgi:hypothetical protein